MDHVMNDYSSILPFLVPPLLGALIGATVFDTGGSYNGAFALNAALTLAALALVNKLRAQSRTSY